MKEKFIIMAKKIAKEISKTSEDPYRKVGCVVLNQEGRILSTGYNGLVRNKTVKSNFWLDRDKRRQYMIHAEVNALSCVSRYDDPYCIYVTLLPCGYCANLIASYNIKEVYYTDHYDFDNTAENIFKFYKIKCQKI